MDIDSKEISERQQWNQQQFVDIYAALLASDVLSASKSLSDPRFTRQEIEDIGCVFFTDQKDSIQETTLLILASGLNALDIVAALVERQTPLDSENIFGHTALTWACTLGHEEIVRYLLFKGCSMSHKTKEGRNALHFACLYAHDDIVHAIFEYIIRQFFVYDTTPKIYDRHNPNKRWSSYAQQVESYVESQDMLGYTAFDLLSMHQSDLDDGKGTAVINNVRYVGGQILQAKFVPKNIILVKRIQELLQELKGIVQSWRDLVRREERLAQLTRCWLHCGFSGTFDQIFDHIRSECPERLVPCDQCNDLIPKKGLESHKYRTCKDRRVSCSNAFEGCNETLSVSHLQSHLRFKCPCRLVECRLLCNQYVPMLRLEEHELNHCKRREIVCDSCREKLLAVDMPQHLHELCTQRLITCSIGCGSRFLACDIVHHEQKICQQPCKWSCGRVVGPMPKRTLHEMQCDNRPFTCRYECGTKGLMVHQIAAHEQECLEAMTSCEFCTVQIKRKDMSAHIEMWSGNCEGRLVYCPSNLVGLKILCGDRVAFVLKFRSDDSGNCELYLRFESSTEWVSFFNSNISVLECKEIHSPECGFIPFAKLSHHVHLDCAHRTVLLGVTDGFSGQAAEHKDIVQLAELRSRIEDFESIEEETVTCPHCEQSTNDDSMHEHVKFKCPKSLQRCPFGCGQVVARDRMKVHTSSECVKRNVVCMLCGTTMWAEELASHETESCSERSVTCSLGCDVSGLTLSSIHGHVTQDCAHRLVRCECGEEIMFKEKPFHDKVVCEFRLVLCPQGCSLKVPTALLEHHAQKECVNKHQYFERSCLCPLGCTATMKFKDIVAHVAYVCEKRLIDCPNMCGVPVKYNRLDVHLSFCPNRVVACDSHSICCRLPLKDYFYSTMAALDSTERRSVKFVFATPVASPEQDDPLQLQWDDDVLTGAMVVSASSPNKNSLLARIPFGGKDKLETEMVAYGDSSVSSLSSPPKGILARRKSSLNIEVKSTLDIGERVEFRQDLRLRQCGAHGITALMAAIRHDDFSLALNIIKRVKALKDFNLENNVGDTALTLACRFARYHFVQLLVENGVDINYETCTGRTALIEAVKASHVQIVDELVTFGASVLKKTYKHNMSAIQWARKYQNLDILRILDLGEAVEKKMDAMFLDISCGRVERVRDVVKGGAPFKAGTIPRYHEELLMSMEHLNLAKQIVQEWRVKVDTSQASATTSTARAEESALKLKHLEEELSSHKAERDRIYKLIANHFVVFGDKVRYLKEADIAELLRVQQPRMSMRIAVLVYGLVFGLLDIAQEHSCGDADYRPWFGKVLNSLKNTKSALQRLRIFNLKLFMQSPFLKDLHIFCAMYEDMKKALLLEAEELEPTTSMDTSTVDSAALVTPGVSIRIDPLAWLKSFLNFRERNVVYDSDDEEDASSGKWIKGKWVSQKGKKHEDNLSEASSSRREGAVMIHTSRDTSGEVFSYFIEVVLCLLHSLSDMSSQGSEIASTNTRIEQLQAMYTDVAEVDANVQLVNKRLVDFRDLKEKEYIFRLKHQKAMSELVEANVEKLKVGRLMNLISPSGYTAVSWAAAHGVYEAVDALISHGSPVGFTDSMIQLAASITQLTYKIYRIQCGIDKVASKGHHLHYESKASALEKITEVKSYRQHTINKFKLLRDRLKLPIAEAVYNGRWEIVDLIYKKGFLHSHFTYCWRLPVPLPPRVIPMRQVIAEKSHMLFVVAVGMNDQSSSELVQHLGWVEPDHAKSSYGETQNYIEKLWQMKTKQKEDFLARRLRKRLIVKKLKKQGHGDREMVKAILSRDTELCLQLCERHSTSIDYETDNGFTALIAAAEENVIGADHLFLKHEDGTPCLAVEFLLDREVHRPAINHETESGLTALIHASSLNRYLVVQALIDRGADVNHQNKYKKTAAHYASSIGSAQCVKLLLERGADMSLSDCDGMTPLDIAYSKSLSQVILVISRASGGNLGPIVYKRGVVEMLIACPLGCGQKLDQELLAEHTKDCRMRMIPCADCKTQILFCDQIAHSSETCSHRLITCSDCEKPYRFHLEREHKSSTCEMRLIFCSNGCGEQRTATDLRLHLPHCTWRVVPCKLICSSVVLLKDMLTHIKYECVNRRVTCTLECGYTVMAKDVLYHMKEICPNRPALCAFCGETVRQVHKTKHEAECSRRAIPCAYKCGELIAKADEELHLKERCVFRFVDCPLACPLGKVRAADLAKHLSSHCENRLVECPLGCLDVATDRPTKLVVRFLDIHTRFDCPERLLRCVGCSGSIKAKDSESHPIINCPVRAVNCRLYGCIKILPMSERDQHERFECRFRIIVCPQGCGEMLTSNAMGKHLSRHCLLRLVECPLKCGLNIRNQELDCHVKSDCKRRVLSEKAMKALVYGP